MSVNMVTSISEERLGKKNLKHGYVLYEIPQHSYSVCSKCFDTEKPKEGN